MGGTRVVFKRQKWLLIVILETIAICLIFHNENDVPLGTMAEILGTLFALVFLLPQIIGQFVPKPHSQNLYETYPKKLYFIASIFAIGIIISIITIIFDSETLYRSNLYLHMHNISLFLFISSIILLVFYLSDILDILSFNHNLRSLKEKCISSITPNHRENYKSEAQSIKGKYKYAIGEFYKLIWGDLQSHIEKVHSAVESLLAVDECHLTGCIKDIFEVIESLLNNNRPEYYEELLDDIVKTSYVSGSYTMKKSTIDGLAKMNSKIVQNNRYTNNRDASNEVMKKSIKGILQIGSSKPEFNHDVLIAEAQESLGRIFDEYLRENLDEFDYTVFVYSLEKLAEKAFENNIKEGIRENTTSLGHIATSFKDKELRINPTRNAIETLRDIGIQCAEKRWENLLFNCFNMLLNLERELPRNYHLISFSSALVIASYCNKYLPEVLPNIENILEREVEDLEEVKKHSLTYTKSYSQIQYSVLKEYLNKSQI